MATVNIPGISTLGGKFGYAVETTAGTKPTAFKWIPRCNDIGEITLDTETIDASAIEDYQSRYVAGRQDTGGNWDVTFNFTSETIPLVKAMMAESAAGIAAGKRTWFEVWFPSMDDAFYVIGQPGSKIPLPAVAQNELLTGAISIAIDEYRELEEAIEPQLDGSVSPTSLDFK